MMSLPLIRYVFSAALRDRLLLSLIILLVVSAALSVFMGSAAITEQDKFVAVYAAGSIRILNVLGLILFTVFFIRRSFESRDVEFMLSRPVSRAKFLLSYLCGLSLIAALFAVISTIALMALSPHLLSAGTALWGVSLLAENIIMVNVALFFAMVEITANSAAISESPHR